MKSNYFLTYSIGSSLKRVTSLWVSNIMGMTMTSVSSFSRNGFSLIMVAGILVDWETYFIPKFRALEPTKWVFRFKTSCKWDSSKGTAYFALKAPENSSRDSSENFGFPYLENSLYVHYPAIPFNFQQICLSRFSISSISSVGLSKVSGTGRSMMVLSNRIQGSKLAPLSSER